MTVEQLIELVAHMVRALGAVAIDFINTLNNLLMLNSNQKSIYFQIIFYHISEQDQANFLMTCNVKKLCIT